MKIRQAVFPVALLGLLLFVASCSDEQNKTQGPPVAKTSGLKSGAGHLYSGVGVAIADMDGDGDLDIVTAYPNGISFFENDGIGAFIEHGVIADSGASHFYSGVGIAVRDIDNDGVLDIVVAHPSGLRIIKNPIPQKK